MHLRWSWFLTAAILAGCYTAPEGWDTPAASGGATGAGCVAGMRVECPCTDGSTGVQECNPDGLSYGSCECSGGGGTGGGSVDGSGGLGGAAPGVGGDVATGGSDSGGTGGVAGPQGPRCDWIPECAPLMGPCVETYTVTCGAVEYGSVSCGLEHERRVGWAFGDGHSIMCPADTSDCIARGQEASSYCAKLMTHGTGGASGGAGGSGGSGGSGGGSGETVLWSNDSATGSDGFLGGIATESHHRATLQFSINREGLRCWVQLSTSWLPTGWTGNTEFDLTDEELTCFRDTYAGCGDPRLHLSWLSCGSPGCADYKVGPVRTDVFRPVCSGVDLSGPFKVRHTVRALGPELVDETWALVVE